MEKGDFTIKLQIRHESVPLVEKLSEIPIQIQHKLEKSVSLNVYDSYRNAINDGKKFSAKTLEPHSQIPFYVVSASELPKGMPTTPGTFLSGNISFAKDENRRRAEPYAFTYVIDNEPAKKTPPKETKEKDPKTGEKVAEKTPEEQCTEALTEMKISWVAKYCFFIFFG